MNYKLGSLFAGVGGIDLGMEQTNRITSVFANEIDKKCSITYKANFTNSLIVDSIENIKGTDFPKIDILAGGFPCQPFSIAGYQKGFTDPRGNMFFEIMRLISELEDNNNKPKVIFLENVKNLLTHDKGNTFKVIKKSLEDAGYFVHHKILNSCEYGNVPQNRERLFIVAFLDKNAYDIFKWPNKIKLTNTIDKVIDFNNKNLIDKKFYYDNRFKCWQLVQKGVLTTNKVYQLRRVYVRENKSGLCPTLTKNMATGGHNIPLIKDCKGNIRKLTPRECFNLQGFPKNYIFPKDISDNALYGQAGNSVSVPVIKRITEEIIKALDNCK